jgi:hypothetical protein
MHMKKISFRFSSLTVRLLLGAFTACYLWLLTSCSSGSSESRIGLFTNAPDQAECSQSSDPTIIRERCVFVNFELLKDMQLGDAILLNLFPDTQYTAILDRIEAQENGYAWIGHLVSVDNSQVTLVMGGGQMAGNVTLPDEFYQIRYVGGLTHAIYQVDQSAFPSEAEPITPTL